MLTELLKKHSQVITRRWLEAAVAVYPEDARKLFAKKTNAFANPVGETTTNSIAELFPKITEDAALADLRDPTMELMKIRAIQKFPPSQAVRFIVDLKRIVRESLGDELPKRGRGTEEFKQLDGKIDDLTLMAFDLYVECHKQIVQIRINELKRSVAVLRRKTAFGDDNE